VVRRRVVAGGLVVLAVVVLSALGGWAALTSDALGTPAAAACGTGSDAEWLGHAWVDGRRGQRDVDALAARLRGTGIRDLFVHAGPFRNDGTLDPALRPKARWVVGALQRALPGVRVQAWLGAHPVPGQLDLGSAATRRALLASEEQVLADGFDGVHLDFEPVVSGDPDLLAVLAASHRLTARRHAVLSVSASRPEPAPGIGAAIALLPGRFAWWSGPYLHQVAVRVDQVAVMAYDTALWPAATYTGYVRDATLTALRAVPSGEPLLVGVPAYDDDTMDHHRDAETTAAALRGVRLALGGQSPGRSVGVALYVDFTITAGDWATFRRDWVAPAGCPVARQ
jgi:hypothetical protein